MIVSVHYCGSEDRLERHLLALQPTWSFAILPFILPFDFDFRWQQTVREVLLNCSLPIRTTLVLEDVDSA